MISSPSAQTSATPSTQSTVIASCPRWQTSLRPVTSAPCSNGVMVVRRCCWCMAKTVDCPKSSCPKKVYNKDIHLAHSAMTWQCIQTMQLSKPSSVPAMFVSLPSTMTSPSLVQPLLRSPHSTHSQVGCQPGATYNFSLGNVLYYSDTNTTIGYELKPKQTKYKIHMGSNIYSRQVQKQMKQANKQ